jgi:hypothetical protein
MTVSRADIDALMNLMNTVNQRFLDTGLALNRLQAQVDAINQNWTDPTPVPPEPVPSTTVLRKAVHRYWLQGPIVSADVYDLQHSQWIDLTAFPSNAELFRYVSTANNPSDATGDRQFVPPAQSNAYLAKDKTGKLITRSTTNDSRLLDLSSSSFRNLAVSNIKNIVSKYDGLYLDEVDATWLYGYPNTAPVNWTTGGSWQSIMIQFVTAVATELHRLGKKLWVNLGLINSEPNAFRDAIVKQVDAVNIEYFVGRDLLGQSPQQNTEWLSAINELADIENMGKPVHAHCSSTNQDTINYAFLSWLMGTQFLGSFTSSVEYTGDVYPPGPSLWAPATKLGRPTGPMGTVSTGYMRNFEHGSVFVNPFSSARGSFASMHAEIRLT